MSSTLHQANNAASASTPTPASTCFQKNHQCGCSWRIIFSPGINWSCGPAMRGIVVNSAGGTFRCDRGRCRHLRHRCRVPPPGELSRPDVRNPRRARRHRRHVGSVPLSRASAPTATCTRSATASSRGPGRRRSPTGPRSFRTSVTRSPSTASTGTSGSTISCRRPSGRPTMPAGRSPSHAATPARPSNSRAATCSCAPGTTATTAGTRPSSRASTTSPARSCTRRRGRTTSTTPARRSSSSARARRR